MAPITGSMDVARSREEVFAYVTDPSTMPEWQDGAVSGHMDAPTTRVGSKCTTVRRIGGREREVSTEITEYDPPRRWADRGIDGPIRAIVAVTVEPLADRSRSRLTIELDFTGHGIGKLLGGRVQVGLDSSAERHRVWAEIGSCGSVRGPTGARRRTRSPSRRIVLLRVVTRESGSVTARTRQPGGQEISSTRRPSAGELAPMVISTIS